MPASIPPLDPASKPPAVVLLSGGLDSAAALGIARAEGFACHALTIDYGQRHRCELVAAARVAQRERVASHVVAPLDLRCFGGSSLTSDIPVPKDRDEASMAVDIPATYVPARNLIFLSLACAHAEVIGAADVFIGVNAVDYSGYPDCRAPFIAAFEHAARLATRAGVEGRDFRVHTPLIEFTKARIIRLACESGVDLSLTHSCYDPDPGGLACGRCDACAIRRRGFHDAGVPDPTRYAPLSAG